MENRFIRCHLDAVEFDIRDAKVPESVLVLPWGEAKLRDSHVRERLGLPGRMVVNDRTLEAAPDNFARRDIDYMINANHDVSGPAFGWMRSVDVVKDQGVFVKIDWNDDGEAALMGKKYRYISPEVLLDAKPWRENKEPAIVTAIVGGGLVNNPAVIGQSPIAYNTITAALSAVDGLPLEGAGDKPPVEPGRKGDAMESVAGTKKWAFLSRMIGREPNDEVDAAMSVAELQAKLATVDNLTTKVDELATQLAAVTTERDTATARLAEIEKEHAESEIDGLVKAALSTGKIATFQEQWAREFAAHDVDQFKAYCDATPDGTFSPPKGRRLDSAPTSDSTEGLSRAELADKISEYAKEHKITYAEAYAIVGKEV